ncbi:MAG: transposase [Bacteroidia bacterium]|nr:transposase [Bacteroidia bacterium]
MPLKTITDTEGIYFLTSTVVDWVDVFTRPIYRYIIIDSLKHCINEKGLELYAWVIMSNHIHLVAASKKGFNLSSTIRDFKKYTSKQIINSISAENESRKEWMMNRFEHAGRYDNKIKNYKFWQDGNEAKSIYSFEFLKQKIDYIHNNPVKAEMVEFSEQYKFSSAMDYAGGRGLLPIQMAW